MKPIVALITDLYQSQINQICQLITRRQNIQIVALPGTGLSTLLKYVIPKALSTQKNLNIINLDTTESDFLEQLSTLSSQIISTKQNIIIIDEYSQKFTKDPYLNFFSHLLSLRRDIDFNLSFVFATNRLVDALLLPKINRLLVENIIYLPPANSKYILDFLHLNKLDFSRSLQKEIIANSYSNFRLAKIIAQIVQNKKFTALSLLQPNSEPQLDYFIKELLSFIPFYPPELLPSPSFLLSRFTPHLKSKILDTIDQVSLPILLTAREKKFFYLLHKHYGIIVTRTSLLKFIWGKSRYLDVYDHSLDQILYRLKKKLSISHSGFTITTVKGRGFILTG